MKRNYYYYYYNFRGAYKIILALMFTRIKCSWERIKKWSKWPYVNLNVHKVENLRGCIWSSKNSPFTPKPKTSVFKILLLTIQRTIRTIISITIGEKSNLTTKTASVTLLIAICGLSGLGYGLYEAYEWYISTRTSPSPSPSPSIFDPEYKVLEEKLRSIGKRLVINEYLAQNSPEYISLLEYRLWGKAVMQDIVPFMEMPLEYDWFNPSMEARNQIAPLYYEYWDINYERAFEKEVNPNPKYLYSKRGFENNIMECLSKEQNYMKNNYQDINLKMGTRPQTMESIANEYYPELKFEWWDHVLATKPVGKK